LWVPDVQCRRGVPTEHIDWCARAIVEYKPDVVGCIGDFWDFPSLNSHSEKGSLDLENSRYQEDLDAGNEAWARMCAPMEKEQQRLRDGHKTRWEPRKVFLRGNHEHRADRVAENDPKWLGVIGSHQCQTRDFEVHPFLEIVDIDGIAFSHYFAAPNTGRALAGSIESRLARIGRSFFQGHQQGFLYGIKQFPGNIRRHGIVAGSFYLHDEGYRGLQGTGEWRGIIVMNEVEDGDFDIMPLSISYLRRRFG
jgi:hypothetical protein